MTRAAIVTFWGLTSVFAVGSRLGAEGPAITGAANGQAAAATTERMNFAPGGTIRLNGSLGALTIEGWDRPEVEITVVKSMPFNYEPKHKERAAQHLERVHIKTDHPAATELTFSTVPASGHHFLSDGMGGVMLDYEIHVPRNSNLVIHHGVGQVLVSDVAGDIEAKCSRGDIILMLPDPGPYSIDAKSKLGNVLSDLDGEAHLEHLIGERFANAPPARSRRIYLRVGFGGITIKALESKPAAAVAR
jgi:hypothetical protein